MWLPALGCSLLPQVVRRARGALPAAEPAAGTQSNGVGPAGQRGVQGEMPRMVVVRVSSRHALDAETG